MAAKFNRNFKLTIQSRIAGSVNVNPINQAAARLFPSLNLPYASNTPVQNYPALAIEIKPPFTIEIDVKRSIGLYENESYIKIYGLKESTRRQLLKDYYNTQDFGSGNKYRQVILEAGYQKNIYPIFVGSLIEGYSIRENVDPITFLYSKSGAYGRYNTFINQSYGSGTPYSTIINDTINTLVTNGHIQKGAISPIDGTAETGYLALGDAFNILSEFGSVFVDLDKINFLSLDYVINKSLKAKDIILITGDTGLIGTPIRRNSYIEVTMMFEPRINLGQLIEINSSTAPYFNGQFKVMGIRHHGIISDTKDGKLQTTLQLYIGNYLLNSFKSVQ